MNRERFVALCCLAIGFSISLSARRLGLGEFSKPEPGMFPFLVGLAIFFLGLILFLQARPKKEGPILGPLRKKLFLVLGSLVCYPICLNLLGFPIATLIFLVFALKAIEPQKWSAVMVVALLSTCFSYLLFSVWLGVEFPKGIFVR